VKTGSWIRSMTFPVIALAVALVTAVAPTAAQAASMHRSAMHGGDGHYDGRGHDGDRDHRYPNHFHERWHSPYYIYRYYPVPTYPGPTYWYYCPSYGTYYPYVSSCPESWVPVPAS